MKPALIITHMEDRADGLARDCLVAAGTPIVTRNPGDGLALPAVDEVSGVIALGGTQSATRCDEDPFLAAEVDLLAAALEHGVPVLGMCLGAQLLAVAGGGRVTSMGAMSVGWPQWHLLPARDADPLFCSLPAGLRVLKWHEDIIEPPPGALTLATAPGAGADLFSVGPCAWGSQAHIELTAPMLLDGWLTEEDSIAQIEAAGHRFDDFRALSEDLVAIQMAAAAPVFTAFAERLFPAMVESGTG